MHYCPGSGCGGRAPKKHGPRDKATPDDFGYRTPILVRWAGKGAPRRSDALASSIDFVPTVRAAQGVTTGIALPGVNLLDVSAVGVRKQIFAECLTVRSQTLDDPVANLLWRWITDGRWGPSSGALSRRHASCKPFPTTAIYSSRRARAADGRAADAVRRASRPARENQPRRYASRNCRRDAAAVRHLVETAAPSQRIVKSSTLNTELSP